MPFYNQLSSDGMRCVQQKGFLKLWQRLRQGNDLPQFKELPIEDLRRSIDKIMFCDVEHSTQGSRFRIAYHGEQFAKMYGKTSCVGKHLDEIIVPAVRDKALKSYTDVVVNKRPYFSVSTVKNAEGPEIQYERLLLPFSRKGPFVQRIVCMVTLFTEANGFSFSDIASDQLQTV